MYQQIDGVTMGSPLGPTLANILVGFYETKLFSNVNKLSTQIEVHNSTSCRINTLLGALKTFRFAPLINGQNSAYC